MANWLSSPWRSVGCLVLSGPALAQAQPAYRAADIEKHFLPEKDLGAPRACASARRANAPMRAPAAPKTTSGFDLLVNFEYNSDRLTPTARANLDEFARAMRGARWLVRRSRSRVTPTARAATSSTSTCPPGAPRRWCATSRPTASRPTGSRRRHSARRARARAIRPIRSTVASRRACARCDASGRALRRMPARGPRRRSSRPGLRARSACAAAGIVPVRRLAVRKCSGSWLL